MVGLEGVPMVTLESHHKQMHDLGNALRSQIDAYKNRALKAEAELAALKAKTK